MRQAVLAAAAAIAIAGGCKKKASSVDDAGVAVDDGAGQPAAVDDTPAAPVDPDPYYEPIPDAPADAGPPAPAVPITESGIRLFDAPTGAQSPGGWTVDGTDIRFDTTLIGATAGRADVQIHMSSGDRRALVATCRGLSKSAEGDVTAHASGEGVVLISCFTREGSTDKGRTIGFRIKWHAEKRIAEVAGRFETEGRADLATLEFGEGD